MTRLHIFDVDNTIVKGQSQRLLLSYLHTHGKVSWNYYILVLLWFVAYRIHLVDDPRAVTSFAYSFLKGRTVDEIEALMNHFFDESLRMNIFPQALQTIHQELNNGAQIILISNAPSIVIKPLAQYLGITEYYCTQLEITEGVYTGNVEGELMYGENKKRVLLDLIEQKHAQAADVYAYGDHTSDIPILASVGHPVAINPSSSLLRVAKRKHWEIHNWNQ